MLLLLVDGLLFGALLLIAVYAVHRMLKQNKKYQIEDALEKQRNFQELSKAVDNLDVEAMKENEKKVNDKLGLH